MRAFGIGFAAEQGSEAVSRQRCSSIPTPENNTDLTLTAEMLIFAGAPVRAVDERASGQRGPDCQGRVRSGGGGPEAE